jgi:5-oxoprolinase (ATP-hydrolysing)
MQEAVKFQKAYWGDDLKEGDVIMSNHPQSGGSHLPDIVMLHFNMHLLFPNLEL